MKKKRPYLLNAMWNWIHDSGYTPHIVVDTTVGNCIVPEGYSNEEGKSLTLGQEQRKTC